MKAKGRHKGEDSKLVLLWPRRSVSNLNIFIGISI